MALLHPVNPPKARPIPSPQPPRPSPQPPRPSPQPPRPSLRLLPQLRPAQKSKPVTFAVILGAMLVFGSLILLLINTLMAQDAFVLHRLQQQVSTLTADEQAITALTDSESSPGSLASKATVLGMVPGQTPVFLDLSTGKVVGVAGKATKSTLAAR